ncbi:hypothetical protein RRG08_012529 [Elysia crispata]|uniref:Uncharacterized protein n=1 Tax=Elysia crispata TaxID=231223 RepID=A0AAE1ANY8_9GAST|nr:hypothetical protein RRG08_012529 [Elysia crispata]
MSVLFQASSGLASASRRRLASLRHPGVVWPRFGIQFICCARGSNHGKAIRGCEKQAGLAGGEQQDEGTNGRELDKGSVLSIKIVGRVIITSTVVKPQRDSASAQKRKLL